MSVSPFTRIVIFCVVLVPQYAAARGKALFHMTEERALVQSFIAHANKIDILVPTWYSVDDTGLVWGGSDPLVMERAKRQNVPVMPIVVNPGFNQDMFHKFTANGEAKHRFIGTLISECQKNGYIGFQFDFENIIWTDQQALTDLVMDTAAALHSNGLQLSIATVPNAPGYPRMGAFARWIYENWRGAYDLKALANVQGFCSWVLGQEDPAIWDTLPQHS
jgi:spore germination protein YaaH